jgi:hypothetical protein
MRGPIVVRALAPVLAALLAAGPVAGQAPSSPPRPATPAPPLVLPVAGTTSGAGTSAGTKFAGTLSLHRFASRENRVLAVVVITGTVVDANGAVVGTFFTGPVETSVEVTAGEPTAAPRPGAATISLGSAEPLPGVTVIQPQQPCGVLHLEIPALALRVLSAGATASLVRFDISGETEGPTSTLVCQILGSLTNVPALVSLLNQLLGVLRGPTEAS